MLQRRNLIAHAVVSQRRQIVPPGIPLLGIAKGIDRFLIPAEANIIISRLLIGIPLGLPLLLLLIGSLPGAAEGIVPVAAIAAGIALGITRLPGFSGFLICS